MPNWNIFFNIDFLFYTIYSIFKAALGVLTGGFNNDSTVRLGELSNLVFNNVRGPDVFLVKDVSTTNLVEATDKYNAFGEGLGSAYDGYSLFSPPHGLSDFGGFSGWWHNFTTNPYCSECSSFADLLFGEFNGFLWLLILFLILAILFIKIKIRLVDEMEEVKYDMNHYQETEIKEENEKSRRWNKVLKLSRSENINDQKTAIMDADNLLEETLKENGYRGETLGEILKEAKFETLQNAWAAHNIRNKIAHDPSFILTPQETKRVIQNLSKVFNEFYYL